MRPFRLTSVRYSFFIVGFLIAGSLWSAPDHFPLARSVQEVIRPDDIARYERQFDEQIFSPADTIRLVSDEIGRYTSQFREKRRNDRRSVAIPENLSDINAELVRLLQVVRSREAGKGFFYERSPYMQRLYVLLGRAYEANGDPLRALSAYTTALRYGSFERPFDDPEQARESDRQRLKEEVYLSISLGMSDKDRLTQEPNQEIRQTGEQFNDQLNRYTQLKTDVEEARKRIFAEEAKQLRRFGDVAKARADYSQLKDELDATTSWLESVRLGVYKTYYERESKFGGEVLYKAALLSKEIETKLRLQERVLNRSSYYRGTGNVLGEERTVLRDFVGYRALLELAHRLNPKNPKYVQLLGEEYRTGRDLPKAIMYYELAIQLMNNADVDNQPEGQIENQPLPPPTSQNTNTGIALSYIRLAGLYADKRNFIRSVETYRSLFANTNPDVWQGVKDALRDEPTQRSLTDLLDIQTTFKLHLADLMFDKTGPLDQAKSIYTESLAELRSVELPDKDTDYQLRQSLLRRQYEVNLRLAAIERRSMRSDAEGGYLKEALLVARQVEQEGKEAELALQNIDRQRADISIQLKAAPDQDEGDLADQFYRLSYVERPIANEKAVSYTSTLKALNIAALLERQAYLAVRTRDFQVARPLYNEMIEKGNGDQATRARQNLELLAEGPAALRRLKLPLNFER